MSDLSEQLQRYIDGIASPITISETQEAESSAPLPRGSAQPARARGRWLVSAAAVTALLVLAGVFAVLREGDSDGRLEAGPGTSESAPTAAAGQPEFELLDMREASEAMGSLHSAVDEDGLRSLWASIGFDGEPSDVDLARWVVVSITIPDDACPPALAGFERSGSTWTPRFVEPSGACQQPLIPKTYLVAINRSEVEPSFTLRLPADETFGYDEQLLAIDVPPDHEVTPTTTTPPTGESVGRVPLPPTGEARSFVLESGLPVWVVHHTDGSVTAVPGVVLGSDGVHDLDGLWSLVRWSPAGTFQGPITWDAWGRSITDGRDADLSDYVARIEGQEVVIAVSDRVRVPGEPAVPDGFGGELVEPELPEMAELASGLPEGWSQVDATVVGRDGVSRLCSVDHDDVPVSDLATCPQSAPQVEGLAAPQGGTTWSFGPLLVEADGEGRILHVVAMGGSAGRADG